MGIAQCTGCGARYRLADTYSKKQFACKKCPAVVTVPEQARTSIIPTAARFQPPPAAQFEPPPIPRRPKTVISQPPPPPPRQVLEMASMRVAPAYAPGYPAYPTGFQTYDQPILTRHQRLAARGCFSIAALQFPGAVLMLLFGLVMLVAGSAMKSSTSSLDPAAMGAVGLILAFLLGGFAVALIIAGVRIRRGDRGWLVAGIVIVGLVEAGTLLALLIDLINSTKPKPAGSHAGGYGFLLFYTASAAVIGHVLFHLVMAVRQNPEAPPVDNAKQGGTDFLATLLGALSGFVLAVVVRVALASVADGFAMFATIVLLTAGGAAGGFAIGRAKQREPEQTPLLWWEDGAQAMGIAMMLTILIAWMMVIPSTHKTPASAPPAQATANRNPNPGFNPPVPSRPPVTWQPPQSPAAIRKTVPPVKRPSVVVQQPQPVNAAIPSGAETAAAVAKIQTYWQPSTVQPQDILSAMTGATADADGTVSLKTYQSLLGADQVGPPVTYRIICLTQGQDFRITYGSQAIFNWEMDPSQFRIDFGPTGSKHNPGTGAVTPGQWVGIEVVVTSSEMVFYVDGQERFRTAADFSQTVTNLHIENHGRGRMLIKSVQMLQSGN